MISILVGMFVFESISHMAPDYGNLGFVSITHYFDPYDTLILGSVDVNGVIILVVIAIECILGAMLYFDRRDIALT